MSNQINNPKVISAIALSFCLSACGQGFKARQSVQLETVGARGSYDTSEISKPQISKPQNTYLRKPAATTTIPVAANDNEPVVFSFATPPQSTETKVLQKYAHVDPRREVNTTLLKKALLFYYSNQKNFTNNKVITVIDYSLPSSKKRLFVIELESGRVWSTYVAHGSGSDKNHDGLPELFTNKFNSNATSLGPFLTMGSYYGENGLSLRMKGLSKANSNAYDRHVVIHGARYVRDAAVRQGRSWGCPAVAPQYIKKLISTIKGGSLVYSGASNPSLHRQL